VVSWRTVSFFGFAGGVSAGTRGAVTAHLPR
jgi:hypothetical protein